MYSLGKPRKKPSRGCSAGLARTETPRPGTYRWKRGPGFDDWDWDGWEGQESLG